MAATHDPQNIADILRQHPYHLDTLLQMSEIYAQMGEQQQVFFPQIFPSRFLDSANLHADGRAAAGFFSSDFSL